MDSRIANLAKIKKLAQNTMPAKGMQRNEEKGSPRSWMATTKEKGKVDSMTGKKN